MLTATVVGDGDGMLWRPAKCLLGQGCPEKDRGIGASHLSTIMQYVCEVETGSSKHVWAVALPNFEADLCR